MKTLKTIVIAASAIILAASCSTTGGIKTEAQLPGKALTDSVSYLVGFNFGYFIKANNFGEDLNYALVKKGMMDFIKAELDPGEEGFEEQFKVNPDLMNDMFNKFIGMRTEYEAEFNFKKGEKFLEQNKQKDGVEVAESGLQYLILEDGNDVKATSAADTVWVHYTGTLIDGTQFDASDRSSEPVSFTLNRVISGWTEGLQLVGEGGKIRLFIPSELGYGPRSTGRIPANSVLIFDVDLIKVGKVSE